MSLRLQNRNDKSGKACSRYEEKRCFLAGVWRANIHSIDRPKDLRIDKRAILQWVLIRNMMGWSGLEPCCSESEQVAGVWLGKWAFGFNKVQGTSWLLKKGCVLHVVSSRKFHSILLLPTYFAVPNYRTSPSYLSLCYCTNNDTMYFLQIHKLRVHFCY
jgi:hypothetical protein